MTEEENDTINSCHEVRIQCQQQYRETFGYCQHLGWKYTRGPMVCAF